MGIFSRMTDIINANVSAMLDKAEDPQKMIRLIIQEMEETLIEVRSTYAKQIAERKTVARQQQQCLAEAEQWGAKAKLALGKQREDLARAALAEKRECEQLAEVITAELTHLDEQLGQLEHEVTQLQQKLDDAKAKQKSLLLRAQTNQQRMKVKQQIYRDGLDDAFTRFELFERRMDDIEGQLQAMDVGREPSPDLAAEIDALVEDDELNAQLDALKAELEKSAPKA